MLDPLLLTASAALLAGLAAGTVATKRTVATVAAGTTFLALALVQLGDHWSLTWAADPERARKAVLVVEAIIPGAFLVLSLTYFRGTKMRDLSAGWKLVLLAVAALPVAAAALPQESLFYAPDLGTEKLVFLEPWGYRIYTVSLMIFVLCLANIEGTLSASWGTARWKVKFETFGFILILAFLIFYYSQGLLYRIVNLNYSGVRSAVLLLAGLIIAYSKLFRGSNVRVAVSRHIVYRSISLLAVGVYLLSVGLVSKWLNIFGLSREREITVFIAFVMGSALLVLLFSEQLRREIKVLISRHFFAQKHDYREEWLKFTRRLGTCRSIKDVAWATLVSYRETFGLRGAALYRAEGATGLFVLVTNQSLAEVPDRVELSDSLLAHVGVGGRILRKGEEEAPLSPQESGFMDGSGVALLVPLNNNDQMEGFLLLGEPLAKEEFSREDFDLMKTMGTQAALAVANFALLEELGETRELAAMAKVSSFVVHDLKNIAYGLSLMLENAENHLGNEEFRYDMMKTVENSVARMKAIIERLKRIPEKENLNRKRVEVDRLLTDTLEDVRKLHPQADMRCEGSRVTARVDADEFRKVLLNLLLNALDATDRQGPVRAVTRRDHGTVHVMIEDKGVGIEPAFLREHLFRPFRSTKDKGLGIGLYQCAQIVKAHGGSIEVRSEPGEGSTFTVVIPSTGEEDQYAAEMEH